MPGPRSGRNPVWVASCARVAEPACRSTCTTAARFAARIAPLVGWTVLAATTFPGTAREPVQPLPLLALRQHFDRTRTFQQVRSPGIGVSAWSALRHRLTVPELLPKSKRNVGCQPTFLVLLAGRNGLR